MDFTDRCQRSANNAVVHYIALSELVLVLLLLQSCERRNGDADSKQLQLDGLQKVGIILSKGQVGFARERPLEVGLKIMLDKSEALWDGDTQRVW